MEIISIVNYIEREIRLEKIPHFRVSCGIANNIQYTHIDILYSYYYIPTILYMLYIVYKM